MEGIQSNGGMQHIARMLMQGPPEGGQMPQLGSMEGMPLPASAQITNEQGQSLLDIRDQIQKAVSDAVKNSDGSQDMREVVDAAIDAPLEANGFDPSEVKSAMESDMRQMPRPQGVGGGNPFADASGAAGGFDAASLLNGGASSDEVVQSFLQQLSAGTNLDVLS